MKLNISFVRICLIVTAIFICSANNAEAYIFTRNLSLHMRGEDVRMLQRILNSNPATVVATSGVGSSGQETDEFGSLTFAAVIKYQNFYRAEILHPVGLTQGTGQVGESTRAHLSKVPGFGPVTQNTNLLLSNVPIDHLSFEEAFRNDFNRWIGYLNSGGIKSINEYATQLGSGQTVTDNKTAIINSLSAQATKPGQTIVAFGFYFPTDLKVKIGNATISATVNSIATQAEFVIPSNVRGKLPVVFSSASKNVDQNDFTLEVENDSSIDYPEIISAPKNIIFGRSVTIRGNNFDTEEKNTVVTNFGNYEVSTNSSKRLTFKMDSYKDILGPEYEMDEDDEDEGEFEGFLYIQNRFGSTEIEDVSFIVR